MKEVLIINGSGGVGKGTFVSALNKALNGGVYYDSIVNPIKEAAKTLGWNGEKSEADRKFLSDLKLIVDGYNDGCYGRVKDLVKRFKADEIKGKILCIDMREIEQIKRAKKDFNAKTVLVVRDSVAPITSNVADANVRDYTYDYVIENNGSLIELEKKARKFLAIYLSDLIKEKAKAAGEKKTTKEPVKETGGKKPYTKVVYISHPFQGKAENIKHVEDLILGLERVFPTYLFLSPIHLFCFEYGITPYEEGLEKCLWLLNKSDEVWVFGDYTSSTGCKAEIKFCENNEIPVKIMED